ncbi:hypothetical protein LBMAG47_04320 [Planctomycetia bacterium]|nr:hypothetical protein LBMAG47_04320 [Planctomycetia bacterium]
MKRRHRERRPRLLVRLLPIGMNRKRRALRVLLPALLLQIAMNPRHRALQASPQDRPLPIVANLKRRVQTLLQVMQRFGIPLIDTICTAKLGMKRIPTFGEVPIGQLVPNGLPPLGRMSHSMLDTEAIPLCLSITEPMSLA